MDYEINHDMYASRQFIASNYANTKNNAEIGISQHCVLMRSCRLLLTLYTTPVAVLITVCAPWAMRHLPDQPARDHSASNFQTHALSSDVLNLGVPAALMHFTDLGYFLP